MATPSGSFADMICFSQRVRAKCFHYYFCVVEETVASSRW